MNQENTPQPPAPYIPSRTEIFIAFLNIGVIAFGGALPWARRILVEQRRWLSDKEFTDILTVCQAVPGPNIVNASVFFGARYYGVLGGLIAFSGIVGVPLILLLILNHFYHSIAHFPQVQSAMRGMAAVSTIYMLSICFKMLKPFIKKPLAVALCVVSAVLALFVHWPMALILLVCGTAGTLASKAKKI